MNSDATVIPFETRAERRARRDPELRRISRGVYTPVADPVTLEARVRAVAAAVRDGNIAVDRTAAWLHGIDVHAWGEHELPEPLEFCAPPGHTRLERHDVRGRNRTLHPSEIVTLGGVAVTTPLRTALDLGCVLRRREALAALDAFARHHHVSQASLRASLPALKGRRGVVQLRELVEYVDARSESPRESWMRLALIDAGLHAPEPQVWVAVNGEPRYRLDLAYRLGRVAIEYDGKDPHSTPQQRVADERRRRELHAMGWTVIVVREGDFTGRALDLWTSRVRRALSETYTSRRWTW